MQRLMIATCLMLLSANALRAQDAPAEKGPTEKARHTAVALNYCRAAFHRIRKDPSDEVLAQEQEKILSNLKLDSINSPDIIKLYTSVLDEINGIAIADRERALARRNHSTSVQRKLAWDVLAMGTDIATGQFGNALRTGANSWWDYRMNQFARGMGLRIDLILASDELSETLAAAYIDVEPRKNERPSDHTPVVAEFDW